MGRLGLSLTGGGITGAMYQVGCIAALEEGLAAFRATDFDVIVGSSTGACVAMALAGGVGALRLYRALLDPSDDFFPLQRHHLLRLDSREWRRVGSSTIAAARRLLSSVTSRPLEADLWDELERFTDSLPAGVFTLDAFEVFLREVMARRGIPAHFDELGKELVIVASDLDDGRRALFGRGELRAVPIARAIVASCAVPLLYAPVRIDGRDYVEGGLGDVAHADVLVDSGCDTVIIVNPMIPVRVDPRSREIPTGHGRMGRVRDKGALWVNQQAWRMQAESRMRAGLARYRAAHDGARIVLLDPDHANATMFMHSSMNFAARRVVLEDGYTATLHALRDETSPLREALGARGFHVHA